MRAAPRDLSSWECFSRSVEAGGDADRARERLEERVAAEPDNPYAQLGLARLLNRSDFRRSTELAQQAADAFVAAGDAAGETHARVRLFAQLSSAMRLAEAEAEAGRARDAAERSGDRRLVLTVRVLEARIAINRSDAGRAWALLRTAELDPAFGELNAGTRAACLESLHMASDMLGLAQTSDRYAFRAAELILEQGLLEKRPSARALLAVHAEEAYYRGEMPRDEALEVIREGLEVAREAGDRVQELEIRLCLSRIADLEEAEAQWERIRGASGPNSFVAAFANRARAMRLMSMEPPLYARALPSIEDTISGMTALGMPFYAAEMVPLLVDAHLQLEPRNGLANALAALEIVERFREAQSGEELGIQGFSAFASVYYRLVDHLLSAPARTDEELDLAFRLAERSRARSLIERIVRPAADGAALPAAIRRRAVLDRIARLQLDAIRSSSTPEQRARARAELERLELEEQMLRDDLEPARGGTEPAGATPPGPDEVRRALGPHEALLAFFVSPDPARGSWLQVVHHDGSLAVRLPEGDRIERRQRMWVAALERRDGTAHAGACRLWRDLLEEAIEALPATVTDLVIVPDGPLHQLPFDALLVDTDTPLAGRFAIGLAPSAAVWLHLRAAGRPIRSPPRALVLADPEPAVAEAWPAGWRVALPMAERTGRLPHARVEGRDALHALGGAGELRLGREASEPFLKHAALTEYRVVHLAAHAVIDTESPARSAILLAPGEAGDDGFLQAREIGDLRFDGGLVVLSACRSAGGSVFRGEGVVGLARSLFEARAGAVVGGLWSLDDREAAQLMHAFYRGIARGLPVARALAEAKRDRIRAGAPPAAWAGVVVLGDGSLRPWPAPPTHGDRMPWWTLGLAACVAAGAYLVLRRRRG